MNAFDRCLFLVLATALFSACDSSPPDRTPTAQVSAADLLSEYKANEVSADNKYKGKFISVNGTVKSIGKDLTNSIFVTLDAGPDSWPFSVQCFFEESEASDVATIKSGKTLTIVGKVDGKFGSVLLKQCRF